MLSRSRFHRRPWSLLPLLVPALALGLALAPEARAFTISASDLPGQETVVDLGFATVTATGGVFAHKVYGGFDSVGIAPGFEGGEIDLAGEAITFSFAEPQIVTELQLAKLYAQLEEDDVFDEQALVRVTFGDGSMANFLLSVVDGTSATWSGPGSVANVSPGLFGQGGVWKVTDPFGNAAVSALVLLPTGPYLPESFRNNDYGFLSLTAVPEPGTLLLVAIGLAGLAAAGRERRG